VEFDSEGTLVIEGRSTPLVVYSGAIDSASQGVTTLQPGWFATSFALANPAGAVTLRFHIDSFGGKSAAATSASQSATSPQASENSAMTTPAPPVAVPVMSLNTRFDRDSRGGGLPRSLASTVEEAAHGSNAVSGVGGLGGAGGGGFIPAASVSSYDGPASSLNSSRSVLGEGGGLNRLTHLAGPDVPFGAGGEASRAKRYLLPARGIALSGGVYAAMASGHALANAAMSLAAPTVVSTAAAAAITPPSIVPAQYFGFTPMGMPAALASDSIAAFAEESASISAGVAMQARAVVFPWAFTATVIAADVVLLSYIHRRALRRRLLASAVCWPPAPRPSFCSAT
jgi:hypothetical protein